ncbi:MAG: cytochrome P450 [Bdellovibrionia bacterium]
MQTSEPQPNSAPGPYGHFLFGNLPERRADPLNLFMKCALKYGPVARIRTVPLIRTPIYLVSHPDHAQHVLQTQHSNYRKGLAVRFLKVPLGDGLLTGEGEHWKKQRRLTQPAFHQKSLALMAGKMVRATEEMMAGWKQRSAGSQTLDIAQEMMRLTLRIAGETMFSVDVSQEADQVGRAVSALLVYVNRAMLSVVPLPFWVPTPANLKARRLLQTMDQLIYRIIRERRASPAADSDLLSLLLASKDEETGEQMADKHLRDEIITLFVAGHETTANVLSWTLYLLSQNPKWADLARQEAIAVLGTRSAGFEDGTRLPIIHSIVQESMRLFPPAWVIGRQANEDDRIGGFRIEKDSVVIVSPYVLHHHPEFWTDVEQFRPERFSTEKLHRFAYIPFGSGPRVCIGSQFAMLEAQLLLATMLREFRFDLAPGEKVTPEPLITLRPKNGLRMVVRNDIFQDQRP